MTRYPYPEWPHSIEYEVANAPTVDGYQALVTVAWTPGMRRDFRDLRFRDPSTLRGCPYRIESQTDGSTAVARVRLYLGQTRLAVLHGNGAAVSESNPADVFDFHDTFPGSSIDTSKWSSYSGVAVSGGKAALDQNEALVSSATRSRSVVIQAVIETTNVATTWGGGIAFGDGIPLVSYTPAYYVGIFNSKWYLVHSTASAYSLTQDLGVSASNNTQYNVEIALTATQVLVRVWAVGGSRPASPTYSYTDATLDAKAIRFGHSGASRTQKVDEVFVRKYLATEPVLTRTRSGPNPWGDAVRRRRFFEYGEPPAGPTYSESASASLAFSGSATGLAHFAKTAAATLALSGSAPSPRIFVDFMNLPVETISVRRNISEALWRAEASVFGLYPISHAVLRHVNVDIPDHTGTEQRVFYGVVLNNQIALQPAKNKTKVTCYDYGWFLTQRVVPSTHWSIPAETTPEDAVTALLGGDDWATETGIEPYVLTPATAWGTTVTARVMTFPHTTTRMAAINAYCELLGYSFFVIPRTDTDGRTVPSAYFVPDTDIDTVLGLPEPLTVTAPDSYLDGSPFSIDQRGDEKYNRVLVEGKTVAGVALTAVAETSGVTSGEEIPIEYPDARTDWDTQEKCDARAAELLAYFQGEGQAYRCIFVKRADLRLYQKIRFIGYDEVPEDWMRIIDIEYRYTPGKVLVAVSCSPNLNMAEVRRLMRSMNPSQVGEINNLINAAFAAQTGNRVGTVTAIDGTVATVELDTGETVEGTIV